MDDSLKFRQALITIRCQPMDGIHISDLHPTWGIETLTAANYASFEDIVDKVSAERNVDRTELRNAVGHWVDHGMSCVLDDYSVAEDVVREAGERCRRSVRRQYPEHIPEFVDIDSSAGEDGRGDNGGEADA